MAPPPRLGAADATFMAARIFQAISLICMIGLTGNFMSELIWWKGSVPAALIGTTVVVSLTIIYVLISFILVLDGILPLLVAAAADAICFIASTVVACVFGKPVSYLSCDRFPEKGNAANFIYSLFNNLQRGSSNGFEWADPSKASCMELKSLWGLSIATAVLFLVSAITATALWQRDKNSKRINGSIKADQLARHHDDTDIE